MASLQDQTLLRRLSSIAHLVLVLSGKGGVGKSSVSVQLALSLLASDPSLRIGLLDVDLTGPSLPRMLGMEGRDVHASEDGWVPVYLDARTALHAAQDNGILPGAGAAGATRVDGVDQASADVQVPGTGAAPAAGVGADEPSATSASAPSTSASTSSAAAPTSSTAPNPSTSSRDTGTGGLLACMSIGFLLSSSRESVVWRGPKKNAMIKQFLAEVRWGELDYLIVDTPPGTSDEHISLLESLRPILAPPTPSPPLPTLSALLVSTPQALALLDVSKELSFVRRTQLPLLGLVENMSGYVCPHCGDVVGVFGQGGAEDFCRKEEERKDSAVEGEGGGCAFLGRIPIDRDLVALLDDVAATGAVEAGGGGADGAGAGARQTLVQRYQGIPSFPIVQKLAQRVRELVDEQTEREAAEGRRLVVRERQP
ncbi:cytosolic Fe-S cluster assembly factor cfd1 [Rhodotorula kratochvilovae]